MDCASLDFESLDCVLWSSTTLVEMGLSDHGQDYCTRKMSKTKCTLWTICKVNEILLR